MIRRKRQHHEEWDSGPVTLSIRYQVFLCVSVCIAVGASAIALWIHMRPSLSDTNPTVSLIERLPAWTGMKLGSTESVRMMSALEEIDKQETTVLREAVQCYWEREVLGKADSLEAESRLFILNRFIFNLPRVVDGRTIRIYGGWEGLPIHADGTSVDLAWPFASRSGRLTLVGTYEGYCGDVYLALHEFDAFNSRFGRRHKN